MGKSAGNVRWEGCEPAPAAKASGRVRQKPGGGGPLCCMRTAVGGGMWGWRVHMGRGEECMYGRVVRQGDRWSLVSDRELGSPLVGAKEAEASYVRGRENTGWGGDGWLGV